MSNFFDLPCEVRWLGSDCWLLICLGMKARNKLTSQATFPPLNPSVSYCASFLVKQRDYKEMWNAVIFHGAFWQGCGMEGATLTPHILPRWSSLHPCTPASFWNTDRPLSSPPLPLARAVSQPAWGLVPHANDGRLEQVPGYPSRAAQGGAGPHPSLLTRFFGVLFLDSHCIRRTWKFFSCSASI